MKNKRTQQNFPEGWREITLASIGNFLKGSGITKEQLSESGHNAIRYGELYTKHHFRIKKIHSFIPDDVAALSTKITCGDILFAGSGETIDEIGKSAAYILNEDAYAGGDIIIFRPKNADSLFLAYLLNVGEARKKLRELGQGQSVVHIYKSDIENIKLRLPSISEQKRIVAVLETWDQAIEKLMRKIEIKKEIKKWLMQELLTGKRRLSGFKNDWELISIDEIFSFVRTYAISRDNLVNSTFDTKRIGNIHYGDLHTKFLTEIDLEVDLIPQVKNLEFIAEASDYLKDGDLIMADASEDYEGVGVTVSIHNIKNKKIVGGLHTLVLRDSNNKTSEKYRQFIFKNIDIKKRLMQIANGVSVYGISKSNLSKFVIALPPKQEQVAIADVLTRSDKEIKLLNQKLLFLRDQKKYLLNNLITGTIRTPKSLSIPN